MADFDDVSPRSVVGRVRTVGSDGRLYIELRNGYTVTVDGVENLDLQPGQVVLVSEAHNFIEAAPQTLWVEDEWVGVVRLKGKDQTVLDANGRWKLVPSSDIPYGEGNTVAASDSAGVLRVLSADPLRYIDLPTIDDKAVAKFRAQTKSPVTFGDFGGLRQVVERAKELVEFPLLYKDRLSAIGARPIKGVLFTGAPGTGKTMLARIIASSTNAAFYEISGPEIFSKWYGQSEELLRRIFEAAGQDERAIIFFDEIDSVAGQRQDESHEASRRVVAQLLTLMDGFKSDANVVVIAATNRPQDIDSALRRPGRFDWEIEFPMPNAEDRLEILKVSAKQLKTAGILPHNWVGHKTAGWSAAELSAIWSEAALLAAADERSVIVAEDYVGGFERASAQRARAINPQQLSKAQ